MATEYIYGGSTYSLDPIYRNPIGYINQASQLGTSVDARTANQVKEISEHLNSGIRVVEVAGHDAGVFESIPKDHLKELNRLAKLTNAELTFHGPMLDPTGITQQGWTKLNQDMAEKQMWSALERSHDLKPDGNINVTFHAATTGFPGSELIIRDEKTGEFKPRQVILIDPSSGKIGSIQEEEKYFPTKAGQKIGEKIPFVPKDEIDRLNELALSQKLSNISYYAHNAEGTLKQGEQLNAEMGGVLKKYNKEKWEEFAKDESIPDVVKQQLLSMKKQHEGNLSYGAIMFKDAYRGLRELYDDVYKLAEAPEREKLNEFARSIAPDVERINEITKDPDKLKEFSEKIEQGLEVMRDIHPHMFMPIKEFAENKAGETFGNLAFKAYEKFGKTTPIISVENHPAYNSLLTTGDELKAVIEKSREQFVKVATEKGKLSEGEAKKQAEKIIGATWDVGHINMLRKYGYTDQDIIEQTKTIAPYVKKVHLSDNFGYEHTELPMGMGNVPIKEMMAKLGEKGFEGPKIVEALSWWQHFSPGGKTNPPFVNTLQEFGVPMYGGGAGAGWNQVYGGVPGGYFAGYGTMLPEQHFQMYGAGFSSLPTELGGQIAGKDSRFSGTPMS
ncbi:MAG: TIM barrel protein [Nanoarchaeota archaeon]